MLSLGMDIGSSSLKVSLLDEQKRMVDNLYRPHRGKIRRALLDALAELEDKHHQERIAWGAACGSGAKLLSEIEGLCVINEIEAAVEGALILGAGAGSIIEMGGQSSKYITGFSPEDQAGIQISINSSCAAGTGAFLEEQLSRLGLELEDYAPCAARAKTIPRIAGRCSVFAKTDITHHQQQGVAVEDILMGLAFAVVKNYRGSVMKKLPRRKPILFAGGVSKNQAIAAALRDVLLLEENELIVKDCSANLGALGAAAMGLKNRARLDPALIKDLLGRLRAAPPLVQAGAPLPGLASFGRADSRGKHEPKAELGRDEPCYLGIDVGSTSTNLVLSDVHDRIVAFRYLRTLGRPAAQVVKGLAWLQGKLGAAINVAGVGVTGSGRYMIAEMVGADAIKDEITAQARAAMSLDRRIDTIFEIGGQDSKFISLSQGAVTDFQMNKVCAAGTGSFLEEQAKKFAIPVEQMGEIALSSREPINLGERCTVFMGTNVAAHLAQGAKLQDITAGLCYSIARNYLNRVVGTKKIGQRISFQGGVAFNQGVVNAFRSLTGKDVQVPPFFSVSGAMGAAILARENAGQAPSKFKGFDLPAPRRESRASLPLILKQDHNDLFNRRVNDLVFQGYRPSPGGGRKTVGIPRALFTFGMFPMFNAFFQALGCNALLSEPTSEDTIRLGQEHSLDETCYPVKLINGHVAELVGKKVDYLFFPDLYTVDHAGSHTRQNFGCAYMQLAFKIVNQAMELAKHDIQLLAPTIAFSQGKEFMMRSFGSLGRQLGKTEQETQMALGAGMRAYHDFEKRMELAGQKTLAELKPDEKAFVLISKIYGVADPALNMGIPGKLMDLGYKVLTFYNLPQTDLSAMHPNMYWPFGQHILEAAQLVRSHPNLYAIFLTHHCCGPDSMLVHFFREIMAGKPYLNIEVDEHSSDVGVITRVEAFVNSLRARKPAVAEPVANYVARAAGPPVALKTRVAELANKATLYLPHLFPYSHILAAILTRRGIKAEALAPSSQASVDLGRKHTLTSEYFSLTALLGDVLGQANKNNGASAFLVPQTEGAETDGQYNRLLRTILDETGRQRVDIVAPFLEDALQAPPGLAGPACRALLAGDLINLAPMQDRPGRLKRVLQLIARDGLSLQALEEMAASLPKELPARKRAKRILVLGEPFLIFNDHLNHYRLKNMEERGHQLILSPMSEFMWLFWRDYLSQNPAKCGENYQSNLNELEQAIRSVSLRLADYSPFEDELSALAEKADQSVGFYAGANGRYRAAKQMGDPAHIDGIINVSSTYENTGIALGILHKACNHGTPALNLNFDGNWDENDQAKIDAFIHYL
ncbi:hypothetical protein AAU61_07665 [Desulfocarbo indianensis]|nr:hypothetical protein AAU61_07665 [Desulfocarbo indianensis]